jgi:hypothetical protein
MEWASLATGAPELVVVGGGFMVIPRRAGRGEGGSGFVVR